MGGTIQGKILAGVGRSVFGDAEMAAPKGPNPRAQGTALGNLTMSRRKPRRGATDGGFALSGLTPPCFSWSQGVALGFRVRPLRGGERRVLHFGAETVELSTLGRRAHRQAILPPLNWRPNWRRSPGRQHNCPPNNYRILKNRFALRGRGGGASSITVPSVILEAASRRFLPTHRPGTRQQRGETPRLLGRGPALTAACRRRRLEPALVRPGMTRSRRE
jgi:hypothetical protein